MRVSDETINAYASGDELRAHPQVQLDMARDLQEARQQLREPKEHYEQKARDYLLSARQESLPNEYRVKEYVRRAAALETLVQSLVDKGDKMRRIWVSNDSATAMDWDETLARAAEMGFTPKGE